jgi:hypothetical protein
MVKEAERMAKEMHDLYWETKKLEKYTFNKKYETENLEKYIVDRLTIYGWLDEEIWHSHFPDKKYPESVFNIVDNYLNLRKN